MEGVIVSFIDTCLVKGCGFILDFGQKSITNYNKRRNVGFGVLSSISGGFSETTNYYKDTWNGIEPTVYIEAIEFMK